MKKISIFILCAFGFGVTVFIVSKMAFKIEASTIFSKTTINSTINSDLDKINNTNKIENNVDSKKSFKNDFIVYVDGVKVEGFDNIDSAIKFASNNKNSSVKERGKTSVIWDNYPEFIVYINNNSFKEFNTYKEAVEFGRQNEKAYIYYRKDNNLVWSNASSIKNENFIQGVKTINQLPELPRGCEVTSLAMLLSFKGIDVNKLELAAKINKEPFYHDKKNQILGDPNKGFVGDMYDINNDGLGVYHKPIYKLILDYIPNSSIDITGAKFEDLKFFLSNNIPVWVIINSQYKPLDESRFLTWNTHDGLIKMTYSEHSVLLTGYDENYIYFSDPNNRVSKAEINGFKAAWEQLGSQAITTTY